MRKKFLKKCASILVVLVFLITMVAPVYAKDNSIKVQLNGENISFDVAPQMVNNRVMVPIRTVFEKLGASVEWDGQSGVITAVKGETVIKLTLKSRDAFITKNGEQSSLRLDAAPTIINGRALVPVRFISESLGKQVGWDAENRTVIIIDYSYFINELKVQTSNFYEYISNQYGTVNTGEVKASLDGTYKYNSGTETSTNAADNINATFDADLNAKINAENGSMDAVIKITGLKDVLKGSGLENFENITYNILFDNNSFYIKSNLFSLLEQQNIKVGDKWIKMDIAALGIPDVKTFQDLKETQSKQSPEQIFDPLVKTPLDLDVNSFNEAQDLFNAFVTLIDNNHFTVTNSGDMKVYKWNITKQDLIDIALNIENDSERKKNITLKELAEFIEFADSLVFDFNMEVGVKNNIIVSSKSSLNLKMDIPDAEHIELTLKSNSAVLNPNNASFTITIPDPSNVINFEDLLFYNSAATS